MSTKSLTPRAKKLMQEAEIIAATYGHGYIGTEHIMMACARCDSPPISAMLKTAGIDPLNLADDFRRAFELGFTPGDQRKEALISALKAALIELEK